jgi:hypothetical protein
MVYIIYAKKFTKDILFLVKSHFLLIAKYNETDTRYKFRFVTWQRKMDKNVGSVRDKCWSNIDMCKKNSKYKFACGSVSNKTNCNLYYELQRLG